MDLKMCLLKTLRKFKQLLKKLIGKMKRDIFKKKNAKKKKINYFSKNDDKSFSKFQT